MNANRPILILDSGLGGLTVARAIRRLLPAENLLYFGDTARVPYGCKSPETVATFVSQIIRYMQRHEPKHVVVACNTASALALPELRRRFPQLNVTGVIEPGAKAAARAAGAEAKPVIGVIATEATIRSRAYERAIKQVRNRAKLIMQATPLLAPIVEEGRRDDDPLVELALRQYLHPVLRARPAVLVLGCTHYPLLRRPIEAVCGAGVAVIDSADEAAEDLSRRLAARGLVRTGEPGSMACFATDNTPRFGRLARRFLGFDVGEPTLVTAEALTPPPTYTLQSA